ncbi:probable ATP-dependent RNA helicase DHX34 [Scaptodrosophila lebanonensis]|uniref:Probable ATP-dependent RNA helicase DHX34 n=1 Tax=Drosophila lebanonensis TaxID=7225 RepID=A0A6J2TXP2_DROLE|nr:probable ATP-dependent RNA helicase DHX34 [Scaptodrosophila lebanonensis]
MDQNSNRSRKSLNMLDFSFLDYKASLSAVLRTKKRQLSFVEDVVDFWQYVNQYERKKRSLGQAVIPIFLLDTKHTEPKPYSTCKHFSIQLDTDMLRSDESGTLSLQMVAEFQNLLLTYLDFKQKEKFNKIKKLRHSQRALPIYRFKCNLRQSLEDSRVLIVAGDTGCGKSTQVPQYLYEFGYRSIACSQPRRLACVSLSKRVAHELLDDYGNKVGFQIRFERNRTKNTHIVFITEGLLLRQLAVSDNLDMYDALILDEIHERNMFGDILLGVAKCLLRASPKLKLILMSATINVKLFLDYFKEEGAHLLQVPGRLFPIKLVYMPPPALEAPNIAGSSKHMHRGLRIDPSQFLQALKKIDQQYPLTERGDALIFVSGVNEITSVSEAIMEYATENAHWILLPLHSGLALAEQDKVFDYAPEGKRKCIVSTNIAETSLTVDGVRFVIDSGKFKEMSYDATCKAHHLKEFWVSKSSAEQRKGRAGRTGPGVCFRLYTQQQYDSFETYPAPEIFRVPLDTILLQMISMGLPNVRNFPFIEAPDPECIEQTVLGLKYHGALEVDEKITPLGTSLSNLPVELSIGKMLLMGCVFPDVEQILTLASLLSVQSPFTNRAFTDHKCELYRQALESDQGDLFILLKAYHEWLQLKIGRQNTRKWCHQLGIEEQRFYEISQLRQQFQTILENCGMRPKSNTETLSSSERACRHGELRQLKALKRKHKFEQPHKQHGALKKNNFGDDNNFEDIRDVNFRLRHNGRQLDILARSAQVQLRRDFFLLKLLFVSGFYPQFAIADEFNSLKGASEQFFHTKLKSFVSMHPNAYFFKGFEVLKIMETDIQPKPNYYSSKQALSGRHQLLCYQSLLEIAKPYLVNCVRLPAAHTLLLFSYAIDTNINVSRVVCDSWVCLEFPLPDSGLEILCRAIRLRRRWNSLLHEKLNDLNTSSDQSSNNTSIDGALWHDLVDFMSLEVAYTISRLLPADLKTLYTNAPLPQFEALTTNPFAPAYTITNNDEKGGVNVCEHVVFGCLAEQQWTLAMNAMLQEHGWKCSKCAYELMQYDMLDQLQHRGQCQRSCS